MRKNSTEITICAIKVNRVQLPNLSCTNRGTNYTRYPLSFNISPRPSVQREVSLKNIKFYFLEQGSTGENHAFLSEKTIPPPYSFAGPLQSSPCLYRHEFGAILLFRLHVWDPITNTRSLSAFDIKISDWRSGRAAEGDGLENRRVDDVTPCVISTYDQSGRELGVLLGVLIQDHPELAPIVSAWPHIPEHVRKTILLLCDTLRR